MALIIIYSILLLALIVGLIMLIIKRVKDKKKRGPEREREKVDTVNELIIKILPYADYDTLHDCVLYREGGCMDLLQVVTKDLENASPDTVLYDIAKFEKLLKKYPDDIKVIGTNFPSSTSEQQEYLRHKISVTKNEIQKKWLNKKLEELIWIENNRTNREFYYMFWGKDVDEIIKRREIFLSTLGTDKNGLVSIMDRDKKIAILNSLNNKNARIMKKNRKEE